MDIKYNCNIKDRWGNTPLDECKNDPELIKFFTNDSEGFLRHFDVSSKEELYKKYVSFLDNL